MTIKLRTLTLLAIGVIAAMVVEWNFVAFMTEGSTVHKNNGLCNTGVGDPYTDFIHKLRVLSENGDANALDAILRRADERSRDIYEVWLAGDPEAYRESIQEILK